MSVTTASLPASMTNAADRALAQRANSVTASCMGSGSTSISCSSRSQSADRLVTRIRSRGHPISRSLNSGAAGRRCSKLSSTRSIAWSPILAESCAATDCPGVSRIPSVCLIVDATRLGSASGPRLTIETPSGKSGAIVPATAVASRVLPTPGGPVSVRSLDSDRRSMERAAITSSWRPTSAVEGPSAPAPVSA